MLIISYFFALIVRKRLHELQERRKKTEAHKNRKCVLIPTSGHFCQDPLVPAI